MGPVLEENFLYSHLYGLLESFLPASFSWIAYLVAGLMLTLLIVNGLMILAMVFMYMERRVLGRFQSRIGPNRVGPFGLLQPIADAIKLLFKEDLIPDQADRAVFNLAPLVMIVPALLILSVIPFGENLFLIDINVGLLFLLAVTSITSLGIFMAGWSSGNRYAMLGSMRGVAQLISY